MRSFLWLTNYLKRLSKIILHCDFHYVNYLRISRIYLDRRIHRSIHLHRRNTFGIAAILLQKSADKDDPKLTSYPSRSLTDTEQRYSQFERECLGLVEYGCENNLNFTVYTDHKALIHIMNNPKCNIPLRIERMMLRLQRYNFDWKFTKIDENISDYTSRHPLETAQKNSSVEHYINFVTKYATPKAISIEDVKIAISTTLIRKKHWYKQAR